MTFKDGACLNDSQNLITEIANNLVLRLKFSLNSLFDCRISIKKVKARLNNTSFLSFMQSF